MIWYLVFLLFWIFLLSFARRTYVHWRDARRYRPARWLSEVHSLDYYRRFSPAQFHELVIQGLKTRQYALMGDPLLTGSKRQGYAWKSAKRTVTVYMLERPPNSAELAAIQGKQTSARADYVLLFTPFEKVTASDNPKLRILAGEQLLNWFAVMSSTRPPVPGIQPPAARKCACGSPMELRVSRMGVPLLACSRYPECREFEELKPEKASSAASNLPKSV